MSKKVMWVSILPRIHFFPQTSTWCEQLIHRDTKSSCSHIYPPWFKMSWCTGQHSKKIHFVRRLCTQPRCLVWSLPRSSEASRKALQPPEASTVGNLAKAPRATSCKTLRSRPNGAMFFFIFFFFFFINSKFFLINCLVNYASNIFFKLF